MNQPRCTFLYDPSFNNRGYPATCPFNTKRTEETYRTLNKMGLLNEPNASVIIPRPATRQELEEFHTHSYLNALEKANSGVVEPDGYQMGLASADSPVFNDMYNYLIHAVGATLTGADLILDKKTDIAFNPAGGFHHAGPEIATGFCFVNDIVLAAKHFVNHGKRVLVLDLDVHHCNGVQDAFYTSDSVFVISMHESGKVLYPGTGFENEIGADDGMGTTLNLPLPPGTFDAAYEMTFRQVVLPVIKTWEPDVMIIELGMDGLKGDPLADLKLTNNVFANIIDAIKATCIPILLTGGGGYNVTNTVRGWSLSWSRLVSDEAHDISMGMGGVMLTNNDWVGGLRDRDIMIDARQSCRILDQINKIINKVKKTMFSLHGIH